MSPQTALLIVLLAIIVSPFLINPSIAFSDINEVTLGNSAIFENRKLRKLKKTENAESTGSIEIRRSPSLYFNGFSFIADWR
jgi:hypothetical protein